MRGLTQGLADTYAMMSGYEVMAPNISMPKARAAAQMAVKLDDHLAEAHVSLAVIAQNYDWDWRTAEKEYRRAIELDPNYATAHHWYAECLALMGRFNEAFSEIERGAATGSVVADHRLRSRGRFCIFRGSTMRRLGSFARCWNGADFPRAQLIVYAYVQQNKYAEAMAATESLRRYEDNARGAGRYRFTCTGARGRRKRRNGRWRSIPPGMGRSPILCRQRWPI